MTTIDAIIVAAGTGERARDQSVNLPKQYRRLSGKSVLEHSVSAFVGHDGVRNVLVVIHPDHVHHYNDLALKDPKILRPVIGGLERDASVRAGLDRLSDLPPDIVLIHDAARPFVSPEVITRVIDASSEHGGALPVLPVFDTVKRVSGDQLIVETLDRRELALAQTPQGFSYQLIKSAHERAAKSGLPFTDDASVAEWASLPVKAVEGCVNIRKLTVAEDFHQGDKVEQRSMITKVGQGFDVHRFGPGDAVTLGGIDIPHTAALTGHSDADVLLHTITDAVFGGISDGDIGSHFPPSDPQWKGAASDQFLIHACKRVKDRGGIIDHVDATIICETPKVGPHRQAIRESISQIMGLPLGSIAVKATTSEKLGFTGRGEGIAAMATVTLRLPEDMN